MTAKITIEQADKLFEAIEKAEEYGSCRYVYDDKPCCIIAQLAFMEGATVEQMKDWIGSVANLRTLDRGMLLSYPYGLLSKLQQIWDSPHLYDDQKAARTAMKQMVQAYIQEQQ